MCRSSAGDCDLPEYCSGVSADCPEDSFEMNGKPCYNPKLGQCYNGQCPTRAQHCWRLFGEGALHTPVSVGGHVALQKKRSWVWSDLRMVFRSLHVFHMHA